MFYPYLKNHKWNATASNRNIFWSEKVKMWLLPFFPPKISHWWQECPLGEPGQSHCLWFETSLGSHFSKGLTAPPKQKAFTFEENWRRGRLCWWCSCHILLVHRCVSPGTGGMPVTDRNCIIKLDKILTLSWQCNLFIKQKDFRKVVPWNLELRSSRLGIFHKSNW